MANTNINPLQLSWSSTFGVNATTANRYVGDAVTIHADAVTASLTVEADNFGTPAAGDVLQVWVAWSANGTLYDTDEHAQYLGQLDTLSTNDPGEDPARRTFTLTVSGKQKLKVIVRAPQGASRTIVVQAYYNEHRMS